MNEYVSLYTQAAVIGMAAAVSPGAFLTYLINQTLVGGWRRGIPVAFSVFVSDPPIILTILFLLNQLPGEFIRWVSLAGGCFVLYMAWATYRSLRTDDEKQAVESHLTPQQILLRGALMNLLSPGPYTFWTLVLGPLLLEALRQSPWHGSAFVAGFYSAFVGSMVGIVILFHQARRLGPGVVRRMAQASIVILVIFGILLLKRGLV